MNVKNLKKVGQLAVTAAAIALGSPTARADVADLGSQLAASVQGFQILLVTIAGMVSTMVLVLRRGGVVKCWERTLTVCST
jgi:hypothetical protein